MRYVIIQVDHLQIKKSSLNTDLQTNLSQLSLIFITQNYDLHRNLFQFLKYFIKKE